MSESPQHIITVELWETGGLFERLRENLGKELHPDLAYDLGVSSVVPWMVVEHGGEMKSRRDPLKLWVKLQRAFTPAEAADILKRATTR
ncbi:hypothetical protein [Hyphomicrobium sp. ghe19]|uniref:hypothetical protein n=1 Tax=Hyphomicrobium sp. ghe19 TaxID=2682968 RepID=UPI001366C707|nr:hypothetical protein HYPP_03789 [Hyphomicrobium sp. ghe19]